MIPFTLAFLMIVAPALCKPLDIVDLLRYVGNSSLNDAMPLVLTTQQVQTMISVIHESTRLLIELEFTPYLGAEIRQNYPHRGLQRMRELNADLATRQYWSRCNDTIVAELPRVYMWFFAMNPSRVDGALYGQFVDARRCSPWPLTRPPWARSANKPIKAGLCRPAYLAAIQEAEERCVRPTVAFYSGAEID